MKHFSHSIHYLASVLVFLISGYQDRSFGQVVFDGSIGGSAGGVSGPTFKIPHTRGELRGGNLFHSFSTFNLARSQTATFSGPSSVNNIVARVTGGPSTIQGTIRSEISGANLYLMNPAGVVLGQGARVDVSGAFHATTADFIELEDGKRFNAAIGDGTTLLTADPVAFGFLDATGKTGEIELNTFLFSNTQDMSLVGRSVKMVNGGVSAIDGNIDVAAAGDGQARVSLVRPGPEAPIDPSLTGEVSLANSGVEVSGASGGKITIRGGKITIDGKFSNLNATATDFGPGGDILISASRLLTLSNGSKIQSGSKGSRDGCVVALKSGDAMRIETGAQVVTSAFSSGNAGHIQVRAGQLTIDGTGANRETRLSAQCNPAAGGNSGNIDVVVDGMLEIKEGGSIVANTYESGNAGNIQVSSESLSIAQGNSAYKTGISSSTAVLANSIGASGYGDAGNVTVNVKGLIDIRDAASIESTTASDGSGGTVRVNAGSIFIRGATRGVRPDDENFLTGIYALTTLKGTDQLGSNITGGPGGDVIVNVNQGEIRLEAGGQIDASSFGGGHSGNVSVTASTIVADRAGSDFFTGIGSDTEAWDDSALGTPEWKVKGGDAGTVMVEASRSLSLLNGGNISSSTAGSGNAGDIVVTSPRIEISGSGSDAVYTPGPASGIVALSEAARAGTPAATGNAGKIDVIMPSPVSELTVSDGGKISVEALGTGGGGSVTVGQGHGTINISTGGSISARSEISGDAGLLKITAASVNLWGKSQLSSNASGNGKAGGITLTTGSLTLENSEIGVRAEAADAGKLEITATGDIRMTSGLLTATAGGEGVGGDVTIDAANSALTIRQGGSIEAATLGSGKAGILDIKVASIDLQGGSKLSSSARGTGKAGGIKLNTGDVVLDQSEISVRAAAADAGTLRVTATGDIRMTGGLITATAGGGGDGGNIRITTVEDLTVQDGGRIEAVSTGSGKAGQLIITAGSAIINGESLLSSSATGKGKAGGIGLNTRGDFWLDQSEIGVSAKAADAGKLKITAKGGVRLTGGLITATAGGVGTGGNIRITTAGDLTVQDGGRLKAASTGSGKAGQLIIKADSAVLSGNSLFSSSATGTGEAGGIRLDTGNLTLRDAKVGVNSEQSDAGTLKLGAENLSLADSSITANAGRNGGEVVLDFSGNLFSDQSRIEAKAIGNGGNIRIPGGQFAILDHTPVSANAINGNGGNITIRSNVFLTNESPVTASSEFGADGLVRIDPLATLSGSEGEAKPPPLDVSDVLQPECTQRLPTDTGSFIVAGKGGTPRQPGGYLPSMRLLGILSQRGTESPPMKRVPNQ